MLRGLTNIIIMTALAAAASGLAGCSESGLSYPDLSRITNLGDNILSPKERDETIRDLTLEKDTHTATAKKKIEER